MNFNKEEKVSKELFMYIYNKLKNKIPESVGHRIADDFFLKCGIVKGDDISYIANHVLSKFFKHYFSINIKVIPYDTYYEIEFEDDLNKFIGVINVIVQYLIKDVFVIDVSDGNRICWKVFRKQ